MRVLVTGAGGFVGRHLISVLKSRRHQVYVGELNPNSAFDSSVQVRSLDITDAIQVQQAVEQIKPEGIIHLAAQSMVKVSWEKTAATITTNTIGSINVVNAVRDSAPETKLILVGSSEEYGLAGISGAPLTEGDSCLPQNPYAVSKFAAGLIALQIAKKDKLNVVHARPFNHFGPWQQEGFVVSDFSAQIARIEQGVCPPIMYVGDLSAQRDYSDVRDIVKAYCLLLENNVGAGTYNICSGVPHSAQEILNHLLGQTNANIEVKVDRARFRPSEVPIFIGSAKKIEQAVGWHPQKNFYDSLTETLEWWREQSFNAEATAAVH